MAERPPSASDDVARALLRQGQFHAAGERFDALGAPYEAADSFFRAREPLRAFDALARASPNDPRYLPTCLTALKAAVELDDLPFSLEYFLKAFLTARSWSPTERVALHHLLQLRERRGDQQGAIELSQRLVMSDPRDDRAAATLRRLREPPVLLAALAPPAPPPEPATERAVVHRPSVNSVFRAGALIGGRYKLVREVGRGGMSSVFQAMDQELGLEVALKVFSEEDSPEALDRFRREIRLARDIIHPNVVRVFDLGLEGAHRYLTMELVDGSDLSKLGRQPIDLALGVSYLAQASRGLEAAHARGVLHRDIKPANLMVTRAQQVKVTDFGVARELMGGAELTASGVFVGTAQYMAPEQVRGSRDLTAAADIYSMGVVAYRLFSAQLPFPQAELVPLLMAHLELAPAPLSSQAPLVPPALEQVVMRCLEKDPARRWRSAGELADAFDAVLPRLRGLSSAGSARSAPPPGTPRPSSDS